MESVTLFEATVVEEGGGGGVRRQRKKKERESAKFQDGKEKQ